MIEIKLDKTDLIALQERLNYYIEAMIPVPPTPAPVSPWADVWDGSNYDLADGTALHLCARHCNDENVGKVLVWVVLKNGDDRRPTVFEQAYIGDKQELIYHAIKVWEECNTQASVSAFLEKQKDSIFYPTNIPTKEQS